jgi:hypothetical protein
MQEHWLRWTSGSARVVATASTVTDCTFRLPNGELRPFARAPWLDRELPPSITGHHRVLSGDFVGVPFGTGRPLPEGAPEAWRKLGPTTPVPTIHGQAAHDDWDIVEADGHNLKMRLRYDAASPVDYLEREIHVADGAPALSFVLRIFARRKASVSVGLHPNLRMPDEPGRLELKADFAFGLTHPGQTPAGTPQEFSSLSAVPKGSETVDMGHVPLSPRTDKNILLCGMKGPLTATWLDEGKGIVLDWDRALLPSLMFWHTDRGIGGEPWNHEFRALGTEPLASAFDLHTDLSAGPNPINARGVRTSVDIDPAAPVVIRHSIAGFAV